MGTIDINALSTDERLDLLDRLWDSLTSAPDSLPVTQEQREELDRRLNDASSDGIVGIEWDALVTAIRARTR